MDDGEVLRADPVVMEGGSPHARRRRPAPRRLNQRRADRATALGPPSLFASRTRRSIDLDWTGAGGGWPTFMSPARRHHMAPLMASLVVALTRTVVSGSVGPNRTDARQPE